MDLPSLTAGLDLPQAVLRAVDELVARKAGSREGDPVARLPVVDAYLEKTLSQAVPRPVEKPEASAVGLADRFLVSVLLNGACELGTG